MRPKLGRISWKICSYVGSIHLVENGIADYLGENGQRDYLTRKPQKQILQCTGPHISQQNHLSNPEKISSNISFINSDALT